MIRVQLQLTEEQVCALKEIAHHENTSVADLIRRAIDLWLESRGSISMVERRQRARAIVGRFRSGRSDVSQRHDDYLAEADDV